MILNKYVYLYNRFGNYFVLYLFGVFLWSMWDFLMIDVGRGCFKFWLDNKDVIYILISVFYFVIRVMKMYIFVCMYMIWG